MDPLLIIMLGLAGGCLIALLIIEAIEAIINYEPDDSNDLK